MIHEIINPSDNYTIECNDMALLTASIFLLGEGTLSTKSEETNYTVPITAISTINGVEFFKKEFNEDLSEYISKNTLRISNCLNSVCLGKLKDREKFFSKLNNFETQKEKDEFIKKWIDKKQTSLNPIAQRAYVLAKIFRNKVTNV